MLGAWNCLLTSSESDLAQSTGNEAQSLGRVMLVWPVARRARWCPSSWLLLVLTVARLAGWCLSC